MCRMQWKYFICYWEHANYVSKLPCKILHWFLECGICWQYWQYRYVLCCACTENTVELETEADSTDQSRPFEVQIVANSSSVSERPRGDKPRPHLCNKRFIQREHLIHHKGTHNRELKPFPCTACGKRFRRKGSLNIHRKIVHTRKCFYSCDDCEKRFSSQLALSLHMKGHTGKHCVQKVTNVVAIQSI